MLAAATTAAATDDVIGACGIDAAGVEGYFSAPIGALTSDCGT